MWVSDHKPLHFEVMSKNASNWQRKLEENPEYSQPRSLDKKQWRKLLEEEWLREAQGREAQKLEQMLESA